MNHWMWAVSLAGILSTAERTRALWRAVPEQSMHFVHSSSAEGGTEPSGQTAFQLSRALSLGMKPRSTSKNYVN